MSHYIDTSAFMKLFAAESESPALRRWWLDHDGGVFSSDLLRTEALRTARRISPPAVAAARQLLESIPLVRLDSASYDRAGVLGPPEMRSLDALHLEAATSLGDELAGLITYDDRLADAATHQGLRVLRPA